MSAMDQQEDVSDDESNVIPATTSHNSSTSDVTKQSTSTSEVSDRISKPLSPTNSNVDKPKGALDETENLSVCDSQSLKQAASSSNTCEISQTKNEGLQSLKACNQDIKNDNDDLHNTDKPVADIIGYKETVIDDVSDSDLELRWTDDDEDDIELNARPLSEQALKQLDEDLGITDVGKITEKIDESIKKVTAHAVENIRRHSMDIENPIEKNESDGSIIVKDVSDLQLLDNNALKHLDKKNPDEGKTADERVDKTVKELQKLICLDDDTAKQNTEEQLKSVLSVSGSIEISSKDKDTHPMDIDVPSEESKSTVSETNATSDKTDLNSQPSNDDTLKHLVKELDVVEEDDKISEIDIDETIVDLKHLIDQDEDTIKQLGLDVVGKSDDKNVHKTVEQHHLDNPIINTSKDIEEQTKQIENKLRTIIADVKLEYVDPMDVDDATKIKCTTAVTTISITDVKLEVIPCAKSNNHNIEREDTSEKVLKTLTPIEKVDINSSNEKVYDISEEKGKNSDNISKNVENIEIKREEVCTTVKESHDCNRENNKTEKILISPTKTVDITSRDVEHSKEKDGTYNSEHNSVTSIGNIDRCVDNSKVSHQSNERNIDNKFIVSKKNTEKGHIAEEFLTQDVTNDSIKINTEHQINRPDVMLDIPTQEFDFDNDFDETSESLKKQVPSETVENNDSKMIAKTVTEIVNQLAKSNNAESKNTTKIMDADADKPESTLDNKAAEKDNLNITQKQEKQSDINTNEETVLEKRNSTTEKQTKQVLEKEANKLVNTSTASQKPDDKASNQEPKTIQSAQNLERLDDSAKPSTSEITKITLDNAEEVQEVTDSLGLLAESSRVMEDEDDEQELEEDDGDDGDGEEDDDDFDPDIEESSNLTVEHSDESNICSELDIQEEGIDIVYGNEGDIIGLVSDSNDAEERYNTLLQTKEPIQETAKDPIGSDTAKKPSMERRKSILSELLSKNDDDTDDAKKSPNKSKNLIFKPSNVVNIVDLEGSSSEEDVQTREGTDQEALCTVFSVKLDKDGNVCKTIPAKKECTDPDIIETEDNLEITEEDKHKMGEIFNLDSDEDDKDECKSDISVVGTPRENNQCINHNCTSDDSVPYYLADRVTIAYYGAASRHRRAVCQRCLNAVNSRNEGLISGIKDLRPLMSLRMFRPTQQLLEISDSDSEGEGEPVGEGGADTLVLEEQLTDMLNSVWTKYNMDDRLKDTEDYLEAELEKMQKQSEEIDELLKDCQNATDKLRVEFYSGFEPQRKELPAISVHDTPIASYSCMESEEDFNESTQLTLRYPKRRASNVSEVPAKKPAIPMGFTETDIKKVTPSSNAAPDETKAEEDKDISVVLLSAESAPADLPPPGELVRPPLRAGSLVYAMKNQYGAWLRGKLLEVMPKTADQQFTQCRVRFEHKVKNPCKVLSARSIAYIEPSPVRMTIGTRVIALFVNSDSSTKRQSFYYSGVIAEIPNPVNSYRYLVFFDDGYVQYVQHRHTRLVCECSALVWEEVHPFSRDFVSNYLMKYPERPMVRMHAGQGLTVEWNGKWWETKVIKVDAALVFVQFPVGRTEWIYRGSTRLQPLFTELQAARRGDRARLPRSTKANTKTNMPYVEYTRSDEQANKAVAPQTQFETVEELRRQRAVAKKSTTITPPVVDLARDGMISRVVYYTPKNAVRPYKMVPHTCGPQCKRSDLLSLKELRTYNPLTKPLLSGWERQIVRHKHARAVMYRAPCGRRLRSLREVHAYLRAVRSDLAVDLFDYNPDTHCLAEFVLQQSNVQKKDLSHGKENVPVPCVNYYDTTLPEFCSYNTERTPTAGVPLNLDPEFLCGCDCEDDCVDKTKCDCWKMTLEGARTIGIEGPNVGYEYRRLPEPLPSGIYECNSRCKCKSTCLNRVVQNPLQLKLQVFKTLNRGWGIRALNDVPKGSFLCIYAGNLLTDATANLDGLNEGDEYLAELDYIEVVEAMKEGYEEDIPEAIKMMDKDEKKSDSDMESESSQSDEETKRDNKTDKEDDDFQPGYLSFGPTEFNKRLRRRDQNKGKEVKEEQVDDKQIKKEEGDDCITISDDEEVRVSQREPSRFTAQEIMTDNKAVPKYRSIRTYFGKDEACYIMDAKVQGNIGRYLNHSCSPNVFVQNVFVDTHDPRFPWVSFFALHHIRAGTELTWNYNYDIGSVPGKVLYCFCGAPNCRGRLL